MSAKSLSSSYFFSLLILAIASSVIALVGFVSPAKAQQVGSNFQANRIIDDAVFYNGNGMTAEQVQQFLNARVPVCDTNGTQMYNSTQTRAQWAAANGRPLPPYVCLKDFVAPSTPAKSDSGLCAPIPARTNRTAAQIIDDVARACNISQQALIVTLQKEQSLITDVWPWPVQYEKAMGFFCPDDPNRPGWCAPEFAGFFNQVYNAARQFQRYRQSPNSFNHALNRTSYVAYQANAPSCGGTNLTMQTAATAGLYNYTPYQPNPAALNNLYGTGDSCSAYGNRNFWRMYNDWFGSTRADGIRASVSTFFIQTRLKASQSTRATMAFRNEGSQSWNTSGINAVTLATTNPINRASHFSHGWPSLARPSATVNRVLNSDGTLSADQTRVNPTQIVEFTFDISVPIGTRPGTYREWFEPVLEGAPIWWMNTQTYVDVIVEETRFSAVPVKNTSVLTLRGSQQAQVIKSFRNNGNIDWFNDLSSVGVTRPVRLAVTSPINKSSSFALDWFSPSRPLIRPSKVFNADGVTLSSNQNIIAPGQIAEYEFPVFFPLNMPSGSYTDEFELILEGASEWWMGGKSRTTYNVLPTQLSAEPLTTNTNFTINNTNPQRTVTMTYRNTGNIDWFTDSFTSDTQWYPVRIATSAPINRHSSFSSNIGWMNSGRIGTSTARVYNPDGITLASNQRVVSPGMHLQIDFNIARNNNAIGQYQENFELILEGSPVWWMTPPTTINITVN